MNEIGQCLVNKINGMQSAPTLTEDGKWAKPLEINRGHHEFHCRLCPNNCTAVLEQGRLDFVYDTREEKA